MDPVRAPSFELVDEAGNLRACLGFAPDGAVALGLAGAAGMVRATVRVDGRGRFRAALG